MKTRSDEIEKLRLKAETSLTMTSELQQVLAQIEASLSRKENQKVTEKAQNSKFFVNEEVSNL